MDKPRIALVGATGAVGKVFLGILEEGRFPAGEVRLCASKRSVGMEVALNGRRLLVEEPTPELFSEVDVVFIAAGSSVSRALAPLAADSGALVVDKSSAFRMEPDVPLVVPEVNGDDLRGHNGIVAVPNCSTTQLVMVLKPLHDANPIARVVVDTYQSVSGTGAAAVRELTEQSGQALEGGEVRPSVYPHRIAFNLLPQVESFLPNGYTQEEMKMTNETRKIMHLPDLPISATCVRVPVMVSHAEAAHVEFEHSISPGEAREVLDAAPGVTVLDDPDSALYPMPVDAEGKDDVFVGRIRQDVSKPNGIALWLVSDNLRKGAATNAIQIAEEAMSRDLLPARA